MACGVVGQKGKGLEMKVSKTTIAGWVQFITVVLGIVVAVLNGHPIDAGMITGVITSFAIALGLHKAQDAQAGTSGAATDVVPTLPRPRAGE